MEGHYSLASKVHYGGSEGRTGSRVLWNFEWQNHISCQYFKRSDGPEDSELQLQRDSEGKFETTMDISSFFL